MLLPPFNNSVKDKYDYLISYNVSLIVYYISTNMFDDLMDYIKEESPFIYSIGYNSGEFCHPKLVHIGVNLVTQFHYLYSSFINKYFIILYSNTNYGIRGELHISNYLKSKFDSNYISIKVNSSDINDMKNAIRELLNKTNEYNDIDKYIVGIFGEKYNEVFISEYSKYKNQNENIFIYLMDINENDYINLPDKNNSIKYNTINYFHSINNMNENLSKRFNKYHNNYNITYFEFLGSVAISLFYKSIIDSKSLSINDQNYTIINNGLMLNNLSIYLSGNNYIKMPLSIIETDINGCFKIISKLQSRLINYPSYIYYSENNSYLKCDWSKPNFRGYDNVNNILCLYNYVNNSICSILLFLFSYMNIEKKINTENVEIVVVDIPKLDDPNYIFKMKYLIDYYKPIVVYGFRRYYERELLLEEILPSSILLFDLFVCDNPKTYENLFNFGVETSDYIELSIPILIQEGYLKIFYVSNYKLYNQTRMTNIFNNIKKLYEFIEFEYKMIDLSEENETVVINKLIKFSNNSKVGMFMNLEKDDGFILNNELSNYSLPNVKIFELRPIKDFVESSIYINQSCFISDYIINSEEMLSPSFQTIAQEIDLLNIYDYIFYFLPSYYYFCYYIFIRYYSYTMLLKSLGYSGNSITQSLHETSLSITENCIIDIILFY